MLRGLGLFLEDRLRVRGLIDFLSKKEVPRHRHSFWYIFGGLSLFFFTIQLITGVLLLIYYSPTPQAANESVRFILTQVPFGWLIRSLHAWSANLMIGCVFVHLFSTYFMRAYRKPRELMWVSGVVMLFLVLGFGFTGYLLPWDTTAYFATQIGTEIPRSIPVLGQAIVTLLRGGEYIAEESLKRLFALHVVILPLLSLLVIGFHITLNQLHGSSTPIGIVPEKKGIPFLPNYLFRDAITWTIGTIFLFSLALIFPVQLGLKADPFASAPPGIHPEWYFLTLFETLRLFPSSIFGLDSEMIVNIGVGLVGIGLLSVPLLDRAAAAEQSNRLFPAIGIIAILYMSLAITLAYLT
jgi:cytochrome b6